MIMTLCTYHMFFHRCLKVTRDSGKADSSPSLKVSQRTVTSSYNGGSETGFYRLSMSVQAAAVLASPAGGALPGTTSPVSPSKYLTKSTYRFSLLNKGIAFSAGQNQFWLVLVVLIMVYAGWFQPVNTAKCNG